MICVARFCSMVFLLFPVCHRHTIPRGDAGPIASCCRSYPVLCQPNPGEEKDGYPLSQVASCAVARKAWRSNAQVQWWAGHRMHLQKTPKPPNKKIGFCGKALPIHLKRVMHLSSLSTSCAISFLPDFNYSVCDLLWC